MEYYIADQQEAAQRIAEEVNQALQSGSVLLLLSGGSNIELAVNVRQLLNLTNQLTVGLIDERYGEVGHKDSNWAKLLDSGFETTHISIMPVLHGENIELTASNYETLLANSFVSHDTVIGIFGMGTDGHTAGILPESPALNSENLVSYYEGPDFERITITPTAFRRFNVGFLVVFGDGKKEQLQLFNGDVPREIQPAQALKQIPKLTVITDQGDTA